MNKENSHFRRTGKAADVRRTKMRQRILNPEQLYSAYQLGLVLRLSADTIRKMARKHEIPYVMVGGRMQFCGWQIKNWMQQNTVQPEERTC